MIKKFFPLVITSSMLDTVTLCKMKAFRSYIQHLNSGNESTHLIAGAAFAKGLEVARRAYYVDGYSAFDSELIGTEALAEAYGDHIPYLGDDDKKSKESMMRAFAEYWAAFPLDSDDAVPVELSDGSKAIEYQFAFELPFRHPDPEIEENLLYSGRADMLVERYGQIWLLDDKTKGGYPPKDMAKATKEWSTRAQFTGYCAAIEMLSGIKIAGVIIREVYIQSKSTYSIREVVTPRNEFMKENWKAQLNRTVENLLNLYAKVVESDKPFEVFDCSMTNTSCWNYATPCAFMDFCTGDLNEKHLEGKFDQSVWLGDMGRRVSLDSYVAMLKDEEFIEPEQNLGEESSEDFTFDFGV